MVLDISSKLNKEKQEIKISEDLTVEVDCSAQTMLKAEEKFKNASSSEDTLDILKLFIGKKATDAVLNLKPTVKMLKTIIVAIMAQVNEEDFDSCMERFQKGI